MIKNKLKNFSAVSYHFPNNSPILSGLKDPASILQSTATLHPQAHGPAFCAFCRTNSSISGCLYLFFPVPRAPSTPTRPDQDHLTSLSKEANPSPTTLLTFVSPFHFLGSIFISPKLRYLFVELFVV